MIPKTYMIVLLILAGIAQLAVPVSLVYNHHEVLRHGKEFRFKTRPVDPNDIFRGKYIVLSYSENVIERPKSEKWSENQDIYAYVSTDSDGYAFISDINKNPPKGNSDFMKTRISHIINSRDELNQKISIDIPFDRFYMEESLAPRAEIIYNRTVRDTSSITYAVVMVADGRYVLKDVIIDNQSIIQLSRNGE